MTINKIVLNTSEGKGFSKRLFTRSYAVDTNGKEMLGYPPNFYQGDVFYGHDAKLQTLDSASGSIIEEKDIIIQHHPHDEGFVEWSSGFNQTSSDGVTDLVVIHPSDASKPFMYLPSNPDLDGKIEEIIRPIHKTIDIGEDYLERSFYGFKLYQLVIIGLVGIVIIK